MNDFKKIALLSLFLLILLLSCSDVAPSSHRFESTENTTGDTNNDCEINISDTLTPEIICTLPIVEDSNAYVYISQMNAIAVEWGEPIEKEDWYRYLRYDIADDIANLPYVTPLDEKGIFLSYTAYTVKYKCLYISTLSDNIGGHNDKLEAAGASDYDDIIFVPSFFDEFISKGSCSLLFLANKRHSNGSGEYSYVPYGDLHVNDGKNIGILPFIDDKLIIPEYFSSKHIEEANTALKRHGNSSPIFENGISISELDTFFNLASYKSTYDPVLGKE